MTRSEGVKESEKRRVQGVEDSRGQVVLLVSFFKTKRGKESEKTGFAKHPHCQSYNQMLCLETKKTYPLLVTKHTMSLGIEAKRRIRLMNRMNQLKKKSKKKKRSNPYLKKSSVKVQENFCKLQ